MSINRCQDARNIIESKFAGGYEKVTGDEPEKAGVYVVVARAATFERANQLREEVGVALRDAGFKFEAPPPTLYNHGGNVRAALSFRVEVGSVRSFDLDIG